MYLRVFACGCVCAHARVRAQRYVPVKAFASLCLSRRGSICSHACMCVCHCVFTNFTLYSHAQLNSASPPFFGQRERGERGYKC